ncbi:hypothetical protein HW132_35330 [Brasilonema sp. CT11]|nr:hypothetical protein [Brasilonema sp. CT11]
MHAALYKGAWKLAAELISHGANVNAPDSIGITPIMAVLIGFVHNPLEAFSEIEEEWIKLLTLDVDVALADKPIKRSLMHYAACVASESMMQLIYAKDPKTVNAAYVDIALEFYWELIFSLGTSRGSLLFITQRYLATLTLSNFCLPTAAIRTFNQSIKN